MSYSNEKLLSEIHRLNDELSHPLPSQNFASMENTLPQHIILVLGLGLRR